MPFIVPSECLIRSVWRPATLPGGFLLFVTHAHMCDCHPGKILAIVPDLYIIYEHEFNTPVFSIIIEKFVIIYN